MAGGGKGEGGKKPFQGGRGLGAIQNYLKGMDYPASKEDIIHLARDNGAPNEVMKLIERFEDRDYDSPVEVSRQVTKFE